MKTAQLVKRDQVTLYLNNGKVITEELTPEQKLRHAIYGETKELITENVIARISYRTKKEIEHKYVQYMIDLKVTDWGKYYIVYTDIE